MGIQLPRTRAARVSLAAAASNLQADRRARGDASTPPDAATSATLEAITNG